MPNPNQSTTNSKETKLSKNELLEAVMEIAKDNLSKKIETNEMEQKQVDFILSELNKILITRLEV